MKPFSLSALLLLIQMPAHANLTNKWEYNMFYWVESSVQPNSPAERRWESIKLNSIKTPKKSSKRSKLFYQRQLLIEPGRI